MSAVLASELMSSPPFEEPVDLEPLDPLRDSSAFFARLFKESFPPELVPYELLPPLLPPRDSRAVLARLDVLLPSEGVVRILDDVWMEAWGPEPPTLEYLLALLST